MEERLIEVVLVEDNPGDIRLIEKMLMEAKGASFNMEYENRLAAGLRLMTNGNVDVVLLDLSLPDSRGLSTFTEVYARVPHVPVIVLTGLNDEQLAVEAVQKGAQDYLVKGQVDSNLLGRSIRYAIERKQAEETLRQRNQELALLNRASQAISSTLNLDQVLSIVLEEARSLLGAVAASVWLIDERTDDLVCRQAIGPGSEVVRGWRLTSGVGIGNWAARSGESLIVRDTWTDERYYRGVDGQAGLDMRSVLCVPLKVKKDVIGVLQVVDTKVGRFDEADMSLLEPLAASAAVSIDNARLYEQAQDEIARRKRAEQALRESEERYQILFNSGSDIVFVYSINSDGVPAQFVEVNDIACRKLGYSREGLLQLSLDDIEAMDKSYDTLAVNEKLFNEQQALFETGYITADGSVIPVEVSAHLFTLNDQPIVLSTARDITERKEMQRQVLHAGKLSAIGQLSASIIHEVSNPIQALIGILSLAEEIAPPDSELQEYLEIAYGEVLRISRTVNRVRGFSRLGSEDEMEINDINSLVHQVLELTAKQCQHNNVEVISNLSAEIPLLKLFGDQVKQVFLNLVINALDVMPNGGKLAVRTIVIEDPPGVWVKFTDTGPGIEPRILPHIFDTFFTTKKSGTGLGLGISKDIVERHRGCIEVDSKLGEGSTFSVWFPA